VTDRPIIFSAPMVRALLAGTKTQTRRLATSPLRRCEVGDRLYVRESHYVWDAGFVDGSGQIIVYMADGPAPCSFTPSIHMPRWASRLTLVVEDVRFQPLNTISDDDAKAEGITFMAPTEEDREWARGYAEENGSEPDIQGVWIVDGIDCGWGRKPRQHMWGPTPASMFQFLWGGLHTAEGQRWQDNPEIVALTFRVVRGNIDRIPA
jgi:hypothetical protein